MEGIHTLAARAYHVCHEAGAVAADILEDTAMGVDVWECLLHALPLRPLKRSGVGQSRQGSVPPVSSFPQPTRHTPPHPLPPAKAFPQELAGSAHQFSPQTPLRHLFLDNCLAFPCPGSVLANRPTHPSSCIILSVPDYRRDISKAQRNTLEGVSSLGRCSFSS